MPNLGDYLGQLMSEIALARMQADLESVRIAELYAAHPMLRTLPVPHLRLPEVNLDVPVLIQASEPPREGETSRGGFEPSALRQRFSAVVRRVLDDSGVKLTGAEQSELDRRLDTRIARYQLPGEVAIDVGGIANELTSATMEHLTARKARRAGAALELPESLEAQLHQAAVSDFLSERTQPPRLEVRVTSQELREAGPEAVTHLRMRITEQGLELTSIEGAKGRQDRLVPE